MFSLPTVTIPAALMLATQGMTAALTGPPARSFEVAVVGVPATSNMSFQAIGTPSSADDGIPAA
jgi:hypothetical protein